MTRYKQGDVVLVPFPYTDLSGNKKRPGLIVSANWYNEQEPNYILVPITSVVHDPLARHEILIQSAEVKQAGLLYNSVVKVGNPFTIHQQIILRQLGRLSQAMLKRIIERFDDLFAI